MDFALYSFFLFILTGLTGCFSGKPDSAENTKPLSPVVEIHTDTSSDTATLSDTVTNTSSETTGANTLVRTASSTSTATSNSNTISTIHSNTNNSSSTSTSTQKSTGTHVVIQINTNVNTGSGTNLVEDTTGTITNTQTQTQTSSIASQISKIYNGIKTYVAKTYTAINPNLEKVASSEPLQVEAPIGPNPHEEPAVHEKEEEKKEEVEAPVIPTWIQERTIAEIEKIEAPETTQALVAKIRDLKSKPVDPPPLAKECSVESYRNEWNKTKTILAKLKTLSCWDSGHLADLSKAEESIESLLAQRRDSFPLQESYLRVQNLISYCRTKTYLSGSVLTTADDRMLLHMLGDVFGLKTGLEGNQLGSGLQVRHRFYKKLSETLRSNTFISSKNQADPCYEQREESKYKREASPYPDPTPEVLADLIKHSSTAIELTNAYATSGFLKFEAKLKEKIITDLQKSGDYLYFQGGWLLHAVIWEIKRETNPGEGEDTYSFRIYNSGQGIEHHASILVSSIKVSDDLFSKPREFDYEQRKYLPFFEKINVSYPKLVSKGFLKTLYDLSSITEDPAGRPELFYNGLAFILDGTRSTRVLNFEDYLDPQIAGTCSYFSIPFFFRGSSQDKIFPNFLEFHTQFKYLDEYFSSKKDLLGSDQQSYQLAKKALKFLSEIAANALKNNRRDIDSGLQLLLADKIENYTKILNEAHIKLKTTAQELANQLMASKEEKVASFFRPIYRLAHAISHKFMNDHSAIGSMDFWEPSPENIQAELTSALEDLGDGYFGLHSSSRSNDGPVQTAVLQAIEGISLNLPLKSDFWEKVDVKGLSSIIYSLRRLSEFYLWSLFDHIKYSRRNGLTPTQFLVQAKLFTVADLVFQTLKKKAPDLAISSIPSLYLSSMKKIIEGKYLNYAIRDARWNQEFVKVASYWKSMMKSDFFQLSDGGWQECTSYFNEKIPDSQLAPMQKNCERKFIDFPDRVNSSDSVFFRESEWRIAQVKKLNVVSKVALSLNLLRPHLMSKEHPNPIKTLRVGPFIEIYRGLGNPQLLLQLVAGAYIAGVHGLLSVYVPSLTVIPPHLFPLFSMLKFFIWDPASIQGLSISLIEHSYLTAYLIGHEFFDLRSLSFIMDYYVHGSFELENIDKFTASRWDFFKFEVTEDSSNFKAFSNKASTTFRLGTEFMRKYASSPVEKSCSMHSHVGWYCDYSLFGVSMSADRDTVAIEEMRSFNTAILKNEALIKSSKSAIAEDFQRKRQSTNSLVLDMNREAKISFDSFRQLGYISGDANMQIAETFSYFKENAHLLREKEYQDLYKKLMFDPGLLHEEGLRNPNFSRQLGKFCRDNYNDAVEAKDIILAAYYLRLNQYFYEHIKDLHSKNNKVAFSENDFLNSRKELISLIKGTVDAQLKSTLYRDAIRTFLHEKSFNNQEDFVLFLVAHIYRKVHHELDSAFERDIDNEIFPILASKQGQLREFITRDNQALGLVAQEFGGMKNEATWTSISPSFYKQEHDGTFDSINIANANLFISGALVTGLDSNILHDPYFQKIFSIIPDKFIKIGPFYEFQREGVRYRAGLIDGQVVIRRKWGHKWYQHIREEVSLASAIDTKELYNFGPGYGKFLAAILNFGTQKFNKFFTGSGQTLLPGFSHWVEVEGENDNVGFVHLSPREAYEGQKKRQSQDHEMLIFRQFEQEPEASVGLSYNLGLKVKDVLKITKNNCPKNASECLKYKLSDLALHPITDQPRFKFLKNFEHERYIYVWIDTKNTNTIIEFPRLNLNLKYNNDKKAIVSEEYGSLDSEMIPTLLHSKNFLSFSKNGVRHVLFSKFKIQNSYEKKVLLLEALEPDFEIENYKNDSLPYFVFKFNPETQDLQTFSNSSKLYLSYLYFINQEYERSRNLLYELRSHTTEYSEHDRKTISWFLDEKNEDNDPRANAVRLFAFALLEENSALFQITKKYDFKIDKLEPIYTAYLEQKSRIMDDFFPEENEIWLYEKAIANNERRKDLLGKPQRKALSDGKALKAGKHDTDFRNLFTQRRTSSFKYLVNDGFQFVFSKIPIVGLSVNVLKGEGLISNFKHFYNIASVFSTAEEAKLNPMISSLFSSLGLGSCENPKDDFTSYLTAVAISAHKDEASTAQFLLRMVRVNKEFPSWAVWKDLAEERHDLIYTNDPKKYEEKSREFYAKYNPFAENFEIPELNFSFTEHENKEIAIPEKDIVANQVAGEKKSYAITYRNLGGDIPNCNLSVGYKTEDEFGKLIESYEPGQSAINHLKNTSSSLIEVFSQDNETSKISPELIKSLDNLRKRIKTKTDRLVKSKQLEIKSGAGFGFKDLLNELQNADSIATQSIDSYRQKIFDLVDKAPADWAQKAQRVLAKAAGLRQNMTLKMLVQSYATKDFTKIADYNSALTEDDITKLAEHIKSFLIAATYKNKINEIIRLTKNLLENSTKWDQVQKQSELANFKNAILQKREYAINEHPEYLAFEYFMGFLIRANQIQAIETLNIKREAERDPKALGALYELIMGSGKTSVLLPLVAYQGMDSKHLNIVILPESLIPSMSKDLNEQMSNIFGLNAEVIDIKRKYKFDKNKVQSIKVRLEQAMLNHKLVIFSNSTVQSLVLLFVDSLKDEKDTVKNEQIAIFRDIFSFLREHAIVLADEADMIFDIMKAHRFSIGSPVSFNKDAFYATIGLYGLLVGDPEIREMVSIPFLNFDAESGEHRSIFTNSFYKSTLKNKLIAKIVNPSSAKLLFFHGMESSLAESFQHLSPYELEKYLKSEDMQTNQNFLQSIEDPLLRGFVATLYTQLHLNIPLTFEKLYKIHYGLYPLSECKPNAFCPEFISVPYHSGSPLIDSRFGSDLEALNYAIQSHLEERNPVRALEFKLLNLQDTLAKANGVKQREKVQNMIWEFFPNISLERFANMKPNDVKPFVQDVSKDPLKLLKLYINPLRSQLTIFNQQISTNALIYTSLFKKIQGVSGTLWNHQTFASFFDPAKLVLSDTIEKTLLLLWEKSLPTVTVLPSDSFEENSHNKFSLLERRISALFENRQPGPVIDQGGYFRDFDNETVAKKIIEHPGFSERYTQIIFYNSEDRLKIYNVIDFSIKDYHPAIVDRSKTIAFWDLQHYTGSDLKVAEDARAVMTVNKNTSLRDLMQAAWRLRGLNLRQSVDFAVAQYDFNYIAEQLNENFNRKIQISHPQILNLGDLLFYSFVKEQTALNDQTYRSIHLGMENVLIEEIFSYISKKQLTDSSYYSLYREMRPLFEVTLPSNSYTNYGMPLAFNPKKEVLSFEKTKILKGKMFKRLKDSVFDPVRVADKLNKIEEKGLKHLPPFLLAQMANFDTQIEVETELEMEIELESQIEQEVEQEIEVYNSDSNLVERPRWPIEKEEFWSGNYFDILLQEASLGNIYRLHQGTPYMRLSHALSVETEFAKSQKDLLNIKPSSAAFPSHILISMNAAPVYKSVTNSPFAFFSVYQKEFNDVLVLLDEKGQPGYFVIIDREEAEEIGRLLSEDYFANSSTFPHKRLFILYKLGGTIDRQDRNVRLAVEKDPSFLDKVLKNKKFINAIAQIKFISGRVNYQTDELNFLKQWLASWPNLIENFEKIILRYKQKARLEFASSPLKGILNELLREIHQSKFYDDTIAFFSGSEDERETAKRVLINAIKKEDSRKDAQKEAEYLLYNRIYADPDIEKDLGKLSDSLELHFELVKSGKAYELATRAVINFFQIMDPRIEEKIAKIASEIFKSKEIKGMVISELRRSLDVDPSVLSEALFKINSFISQFSENFMNDQDFVKEIYSDVLKNIFNKTRTIYKNLNLDLNKKIKGFLSLAMSNSASWETVRLLLDTWLEGEDLLNRRIALSTWALIVHMNDDLRPLKLDDSILSAKKVLSEAKPGSAIFKNAADYISELLEKKWTPVLNLLEELIQESKSKDFINNIFVKFVPILSDLMDSKTDEATLLATLHIWELFLKKEIGFNEAFVILTKDYRKTSIQIKQAEFIKFYLSTERGRKKLIAEIKSSLSGSDKPKNFLLVEFLTKYESFLYGYDFIEDLNVMLTGGSRQLSPDERKEFKRLRRDLAQGTSHPAGKEEILDETYEAADAVCGFLSNSTLSAPEEVCTP